MSGGRVRRMCSRGEDSGAVAIIVAALVVVLFAMAALGVDIAQQVRDKQDLRDTMDTAAHAGAYELPGNGAGAAAAAIAMAQANDAEADPVTDLWCVVASTGTPPTPDTAQIPSTCDPGAGPYTVARYPGMRCNDAICAIPCVPAQGDICNTIRVADSATVPYAFAPVIGVNEGSTGEVVSVACKGSCGAEVPNPMDIVFMADRTASMSESNRSLMKSAIEQTLLTMTPSMHYVALGTLHKSTGTGTCRTNPLRPPSGQNATGSNSNSRGTWIPEPFSNNYLTGAVTPTANASSSLVAGLRCLPESPSGEYGTHLAAALKGAARYLLGYDPNNLATLPARPGTAKKAIIFETDGMPDEVNWGDGRDAEDAPWAGGSTALTSSQDPTAGFQASGYTEHRRDDDDYHNTAGQQGCNNFKTVASQTKAQGALIVTIAFGDAATARCKKFDPHGNHDGYNYSSEYVRDVLAAAASPNPTTGAASTAGDCSTASGRATENADGDYFFCAASGAELAGIFRTAISALTNSIKLIKLP